MYKFKVWTDGIREYFQWGIVEKEYDKKLQHKKDFEFTQSLLDFIDLSVDELYEPTEKMGKMIKELYGKKDGSGDTFNLRRAFDSLAKKHIFFEFVRIDWIDKIERYEQKKIEGDISRALWYKDIHGFRHSLAHGKVRLRTC